MEYVIEMLNIRKEFPGVIANDNINLKVKKGEIHALLGENGAGKSTLMNVLFGLYQPEHGEIKIKGEKVDITNPNIANDLGIGMVHQHFMLVEPFTVTQNIILGSEPKKMLTVDLKKAEKEVQALSDQYGLRVDPRAKIRDISVGMQQRVEILKMLYRGADVLILDEPTAVLTPQEINELFEILQSLVDEGKSIVLITHKLKEILKVCDRCTVIRKGVGIGTVHVKDTTTEELASLMVGRSVSFTTVKAPVRAGEVVLKVNDLHINDFRQVPVVKGLDLEVKENEIVGIAGIDGNGQTELIEAIAGLRKVTGGAIHLKNEEITNLNPRKITEKGVAHIPQDRQKLGLILNYTVAENIALQSYYQKPFSKNKVLRFKEMHQFAQRIVDEYDVRTPSIHTMARALSGGNQQKVIIGREVDRSPNLLIAAQPTRGLDVGAIEFIHKKLIEERDKGRAILLLSFELDEILNVSDRIVVVFDGQIVANLKPEETNEQQLGLLMAGSSINEKEGGTS